MITLSVAPVFSTEFKLATSTKVLPIIISVSLSKIMPEAVSIITVVVAPLLIAFVISFIATSVFPIIRLSPSASDCVTKETPEAVSTTVLVVAPLFVAVVILEKPTLVFPIVRSVVVEKQFSHSATGEATALDLRSLAQFLQSTSELPDAVKITILVLAPLLIAV